MTTRCFSVVRGKRIRVTRLGPCGVPPEPEESDAFVVSDGFVTVSLSVEVEEGEETVVKNANGDLCINDMNDHNIKRMTMEIELCQVDPDLYALLSKADLVTNGSGDTAGFRLSEGRVTQEYAFELWSGVPGADCEDGTQEFGYFLLPRVAGGVLGDITVEDDATTFTISNAYTKSRSAWGSGPYDVSGTAGSAEPLADPIGALDHFHMELTQVPPPDAECGAQPAPSAA